jgi:hypothetical protein
MAEGRMGERSVEQVRALRHHHHPQVLPVFAEGLVDGVEEAALHRPIVDEREQLLELVEHDDDRRRRRRLRDQLRESPLVARDGAGLQIPVRTDRDPR